MKKDKLDNIKRILTQDISKEQFTIIAFIAMFGLAIIAAIIELYLTTIQGLIFGLSLTVFVVIVMFVIKKTQ